MTTQTYNPVISWNTAKNATGFGWKVYSIGYQVDTKVHADGTEPTRARAKGAAIRAMRVHKAAQRSEQA